MNTAVSGYIQRRIVKLTEDIKTQYDGTCRDTIGSIYQLSYNDNGINPSSTVKVGNCQEIVDIQSLTNKLNIKYEDSLKKPSKKQKTSKDLNEIFVEMSL